VKERITVAITGASGAVYGVRFVEVLLKYGMSVNLIISRWGFEVIRDECGVDLQKGYPRSVVKFFKTNEKNLTIYDDEDLSAEMSSGSSGNRKMVIIPCSMGTLGRIASGISSKLIERCADVVLKEKGKLIVVPRETPLNAIHLKNMLLLECAGAHIIPAMPGFYHKPKKIEDLVDFVVGKVLDALGIQHDLYRRWG
jgi:4-hydroxy-3-polyprenylbenzoate decarboxylase